MARNQFIKKAHTVMEYTPYQIQEIRKCKNDPIYFIETYVKIVHPTKGAVNFELYDYQRDLIHNYHTKDDCIVLSARQTGKCNFKHTKISCINTNKISIIKKIILWIVNRKLYNEIYTEKRKNIEL